MAYRYGDRNQAMQMPPTLEEWIPPDAPVRAYDAIVECLDWSQLGLEYKPDKVGPPEYDPKAMLKLLVYGYAYGVRSSRKLEREVHYNFSFIWLMGGLKPDHKTIAEFRRRHRETLKNVIRECARLCAKLGLIEGETLYVDGSKMRANAAIERSWDPKKCAEHLQQLQTRVEEILAECERVDGEESAQGSWVQLQEELAEQKKRIERIQQIQERLEQEGKASLNGTDPECVRVKGRQGSHAGYNAQLVTDGEHGLIVHSDVVAQSNDLGQLGPQVESAQETLGRSCAHSAADAGYADYKDLRTLSEPGIDVVVPTKSQASQDKGQPPGAFDKRRFVYEEERDAYRCPAGQCLDRKEIKKRDQAVEYKTAGEICRACPHFGVCTRSPRGRIVTRYDDEEYREERAQRYASAEGQAIYARRKEVAELPFGHIKRNLGAGHFLLRGLEGVRAEMSLLATAFNAARLITLKGVEFLVALGGKGQIQSLPAAA